MKLRCNSNVSLPIHHSNALTLLTQGSFDLATYMTLLFLMYPEWSIGADTASQFPPLPPLPDCLNPPPPRGTLVGQ